jgi:hypothetical protein
MNKAVIIIPIILIVAAAGVYFYLQNSKVDTTPINTGGNSQVNNTKPPTKVVNVVKYKSVSGIDTQGTNTEAFSMIIPTDWTFDSEISWLLDNPLMPATAQFTAHNSNGTVEFDGYPNQSLFWTDNPLVQYTNPPGSKYFGSLVMEPLSPIEALRDCDSKVQIRRY